MIIAQNALTAILFPFKNYKFYSFFKKNIFRPLTIPPKQSSSVRMSLIYDICKVALFSQTSVHDNLLFLSENSIVCYEVKPGGIIA